MKKSKKFSNFAHMEKRGFFSRHSSALLQTLVWTLLVIVPALSIYAADPDNITGVLTWGVPVLGWMIMFYSNYFLFIPRFLFRHKAFRFTFINIFTGLAVMVATELVDLLIMGNKFELSPLILLGLIGYFVIFMFLIMAAISIRSLQRNKKLEEDRERTQREHTEMELARLKSQLNPHFLFNSLNNISALSAIDPEGAQQAIETLSSMLRYVLYDTAAPLVTMEAEMRFIRNYVALMSLRYTDKLRLTMTDDEQLDLTVQVPPMLFISLIENAFKYGASSTQPSRIDISTSMPEPDKISMRITNTLLTPGISAPADKVRPEKHGVGLRNLRRRLEIIFPGCHRLRYGMNEEGLYVAIITIPVTHAKND